MSGALAAILRESEGGCPGETHCDRRMLTDAALRAELRWCLLGPVLLSTDLPLLPLLPELSAWLESADLTPQHHAPSRLGRRFESHWAWALGGLPGWQLLAHEQQLRHGGRTLGAPDLLARHGEAIWHIELAVKFYLCQRGASGESLSDWVGPAGVDRLDRKLDRMRTHQLPLLERPEARDAMRALGLPLPTHRGAVLRGVLFSHWLQDHPRAAGRWCGLSALPEALSCARLLHRREWLGASPAGPLLSGSALVDAVTTEHQRGPAQLSTPEGQRWMVVSSTSPAMGA